jgi:hypothetical protein
VNVVKTISTSVKNAVRFVKFLRMGKSDVQECRQIAPYGMDSNPIENMVAIYSKTGEDGKNVIIGYVNKNQIADVGENRIFSTDSDGNVQFFLHLKNDGTAEFGGDSRTMVRYQELESAFNQLKSDFNAHVAAYNSHIHPFVGVASGAPSSTTPTASSVNPSSADISGAEIQEIKTL